MASIHPPNHSSDRELSPRRHHFHCLWFTSGCASLALSGSLDPESTQEIPPSIGGGYTPHAEAMAPCCVLMCSVSLPTREKMTHAILLDDLVYNYRLGGKANFFATQDVNVRVLYTDFAAKPMISSYLCPSDQV
jgi:hypothetical protein